MKGAYALYFVAALVAFACGWKAAESVWEPRLREYERRLIELNSDLAACQTTMAESGRDHTKSYPVAEWERDFNGNVTTSVGVRIPLRTIVRNPAWRADSIRYLHFSGPVVSSRTWTLPDHSGLGSGYLCPCDSATFYRRAWLKK